MKKLLLRIFHPELLKEQTQLAEEIAMRQTNIYHLQVAFEETKMELLLLQKRRDKALTILMGTAITLMIVVYIILLIQKVKQLRNG